MNNKTVREALSNILRNEKITHIHILDIKEQLPIFSGNVDKLNKLIEENGELLKRKLLNRIVSREIRDESQSFLILSINDCDGNTLTTFSDIKRRAF